MRATGRPSRPVLRQSSDGLAAHGSSAAPRRHQLTGPEALTFAEAAEHITNAGRPVEYVAVDAADYTEQLIARGVPRTGAELLTGIFTGIADGHAPGPANGVPEALGRPARPFKTFADNAFGTHSGTSPNSTP